MERSWANDQQTHEANSLSWETDFSIYTLRQLFKERYWVDARTDLIGSRHLEKEIQKRCAYIREQIDDTPSSAARSRTRFRPVGFILGLFFLTCSIGPFVVVQLLETIHVIHDPNGDQLTLAGAWALLTLPFALPAYMIGAIRDAGRVVKWLSLAGRAPLNLRENSPATEALSGKMAQGLTHCKPETRSRFQESPRIKRLLNPAGERRSAS